MDSTNEILAQEKTPTYAHFFIPGINLLICMLQCISWYTRGRTWWLDGRALLERKCLLAYNFWHIPIKALKGSLIFWKSTYLQIRWIAQIVVFLPKVLNGKEKQDFSAQNSIRILFCIIPHKKVKASIHCQKTVWSYLAQLMSTRYLLEIFFYNKGSSYLGYNKAVVQKEELKDRK